MKMLSMALSVMVTVLLVGCEKKPPTPTKTEVRSMNIAGMPVYEKDYLLSAKTETIVRD